MASGLCRKLFYSALVCGMHLCELTFRLFARPQTPAASEARDTRRCHTTLVHLHRSDVAILASLLANASPPRRPRLFRGPRRLRGPLRALRRARVAVLERRVLSVQGLAPRPLRRARRARADHGRLERQALAARCLGSLAGRCVCVSALGGVRLLVGGCRPRPDEASIESPGVSGSTPMEVSLSLMSSPMAT